MDSVHLVHCDDELTNTEGVGEQNVLIGLTFRGDTSFKLSLSGRDGENSSIGLGGSSDHVLDEISVARCINDGDLVGVSLKLVQGDVDGDTTFTLILLVVQDPGVLERALSHFVGFLLVLFDGTLVDTSTLVDEMSSGG